MKNKIYFLSIVVILLFTNQLFAQVIVVQSGNNASVFSDLDVAIAAAQSGDYVYLSSGLYVIHGIAGSTSEGIHFYKPLHIIGAGISADSTAVTGITTIYATTGTGDNNSVNIGSGASGSTFDGINFDGSSIYLAEGIANPDTSGHFIFNRCIMNGLNFKGALGGTPLNASAELHECIIKGSGFNNAGVGNTSATLDRCIVGSATGSSAAVHYTNCVMNGVPFSGTVTNSIIFAGINNFANQGGAVFTNCLLGDGQPVGPDVFSNCSFSVSVPDLFVNATAPIFSWAFDYHLASGSAAIGFGNDSHDAGIYGSATPTKAGWVPYNPHFISTTIPTATDNSDNLNVKIHLAAQTY